MTEPDENWRRLASMLMSRRVELGYVRRTQFAKRHGLSHDRTVSDLENARRTNFEAPTIAHIEHLYQWVPGSIATVLDGGDPRPLEQPTPHRAERVECRPVVLDVEFEVLAGLSPAEQAEALTAAKLALLERARQLRQVSPAS